MLGTSPIFANRRGKAFVTQNACIECKRKKTKCDGQKPCARCLASETETCKYAVSVRDRKCVMRKRIEELETYRTYSERVLHSLSSKCHSGSVLEQLKEGKSLEGIYSSLTAGQASQSESSVSTSAAMSLCSQPSEIDSVLSASSIQSEQLYGYLGVEIRGPNCFPDRPWTTVTANSELVKHLHSLYFCWEHPTFSVLSKNHFIQDREAGRRRYCSPLLVNVIAALGCRFSDRPEIRMELDGGEKFYAEAEKIWELEPDDFSLPSIQATALMSLWEASNGRDSKGLFYARQATSMAVEAGLNNHRNKEWTSEGGAEVRSVTFWGTFILDQFWSLCLGRIPHLSCKGSFMIPPLIIDDEDQTDWTPYTDDGMLPDSRAKQPSNTRSVFKGICELSKIAHESLYVLYSPRTPINSREIMGIYSQYLSWYDNMLEVLKNGDNSTPTAMFTHIYYHFAILLLFGPFTGLQLLDSSVLAREICLQAANAISTLIRSYRNLYSLRRTPSFMPYISFASSIVHLVFASTHEYKIYGTFTEALRGVSDLHEMSPSHLFADYGRYTLRAMTVRSMAGTDWLQSDEDGPSHPTEGSSHFSRNAEKILPRRLFALEGSVFSPYLSQISTRAGCGEKLRLNGFELISPLP